MNWLGVTGIIYSIFIIAVCILIVYETRSTQKTVTYLLLTILVPVAGVIFYLFFGINPWKTKLFALGFPSLAKGMNPNPASLNEGAILLAVTQSTM